MSDELVSSIRELLSTCSADQKRLIFSDLRKEVPIHEFEHVIGAPAEMILEAVHRAPELTRRMLRGVIADAAFRQFVIPPLLGKGWKDVTPEGSFNEVKRESQSCAMERSTASRTTSLLLKRRRPVQATTLINKKPAHTDTVSSIFWLFPCSPTRSFGIVICSLFRGGCFLARTNQNLQHCSLYLCCPTGFGQTIYRLLLTGFELMTTGKVCLSLNGLPVNDRTIRDSGPCQA
jgi:hypothetical protein